MPLKRLGGFGHAPLQEQFTLNQHNPTLVTLTISNGGPADGYMPSAVHPTGLLLEALSTEESFDGSTQSDSFVVDLSGQNKVTIAFWLYYNAYIGGERGIASYTTNVGGNSAFYIEPESSHGAVCEIGMTQNANQFWSRSFAQPSAAVYHHYVYVLDRTGPSITVYLDGSVISTANLSAAGMSGNFANSSLQFGRANTTIWGACKVKHVGVWAASETLSQADINALAGIGVGADSGVATILRQPGKVISTSDASVSTLSRVANRTLSYASTTVNSLVRFPKTTLNALRQTAFPDGVISGGIVTASPTGPFPLEIIVSRPFMRLNGIIGTMVDNFLIPSAGDPTFDRLDVVYAISPAPWTGTFSGPNPPGYDTERVEGIPSASPVLPGSVYAPSNPFTPVGYDGTVYFAALYSYRVPAGATSSSQFTNFTDQRQLTTGIGNSLASLIKQIGKILSTSEGDVTSIQRNPTRILSVSSPSSSSLLRAPARLLTGAVTSIVSLIRNPSRSITSTGTNATTLTKQPNRVLTTAAVTVSSLAFAVSIVLAVVITTVAAIIAAIVTGGIVLTCIGASVANLIKQPNKNLSSSGGDNSTLTRTPNRTLTSIGVTSSILSRAAARVLFVVTLPVVALRKTAARILTVSETSIPVVLTIRQKNATLTSTGGDTSSIQRTPTKKLSASGNSISSLRRQVVKILAGIIGDSTSLTRSPSHSLQVTSPASTSILRAIGKTLSSSATGIASIASHVFPFVAHLFAISRVYKQWQFDGYQVYQVNLARQRFDIVASKVYSIGRVFKRWQ